jgi:DNA replication protein DnaC
MKREIGDILPDQSDDIRFNTIKHLEGYYHQIIDSCTKCEGAGRYLSKKDPSKVFKCKCGDSFKIIIELLKSNFPQAHLGITASELFERTVVEMDISNPDKKIGKPFSFNKVFMKSFINNYEFMIQNSCSSLFVGDNESGKTYAALYMLAELVRKDVSGHYLRFKNYLNILNSSYNNADDKKLLNQIRKVKFLIIDELGKEHGKAEYATCELEELIKYRQDNLSCTILISNLDYEDFVKTYGNHVKSAFNKNFKILVFHPDAQLRKKTRIEWPT